MTNTDDDLIFESADIDLGSGRTLSLGGLGLSELLTLFYRHRAELTAAFDKALNAKKGGKQLSLDDIPELVAGLLLSAPVIVAEMITLATGNFTEERALKMRRMPAPKQLEAIQAVARLTFTSDLPPKKALALVLSIAQGTRATLEDIANPAT